MGNNWRGITWSIEFTMSIIEQILAGIDPQMLSGITGGGAPPSMGQIPPPMPAVAGMAAQPPQQQAPMQQPAQPPLGGLMGNPLLGAGMGMLAAGYDSRVNPWTSAMQGMMNMQMMKNRSELVGAQKDKIELEKAANKRDLEIRQANQKSARDWLSNYAKDGVSDEELRAVPYMRQAAITGDTEAVTKAGLALAPSEPDAWQQKVARLEELGYSPREAMNMILGEGGTDVTVNVGDNQQPTKTTLNKIQGDIIAAERDLEHLSTIGDAYSEEFLTGVGQLKATAGRFADRWLGSNDPTGLAAFAIERTKFLKPLEQFYLRYRKEITGVAGGEKEMEAIINSLFTEKMGPGVFMASFEDFMDRAIKNLEDNKRRAREGINVGEPQPTEAPPINWNDL
jgi:hypothetical protein